MKKIIMSVISIPIALLFSVGEMFRNNNANEISNNLMQSILNSESADEIFLQGFCIGCIVPLMFAVLWGTYFYHDLQIGSVYIFTRQKSRIKWYVKHCLSLVMYCAVYSILFTAVKYIICFGSSSELFRSNNIISAVRICLSSIQIGLVGAVIINFFVIFFGSSVGYLLGIVANAAILAAGYFTRFSKHIMMSANPFTAYIRSFWGGFNATEFLIQLISILLIMLLGYSAVRNMDIGLSNKEI